MSRFSLAHINAEQLVRQQTSRLITDNPCEENLLELCISEKSQIKPLQSAIQVDELLAQCGLDVYLRGKEIEQSEKNAKVKYIRI